jgi:uncharacterized protein YjbJ (UPF0337 family)
MIIRAIAAQFQRLMCLGLVALAVGSGVFLSWSSPALALGNRAGDIVQSRAEREFDSKAGAGSANQIEGQVQEEFGKAQRQVNKVTGGADGIDNQVKGRVRRETGRAQGAFDDTSDVVEDAAEGFVDAVKDFFGQ